MFRYDLYVFDREGGLIVGYHPFHEQDHQAAINYAATLVEQRPMELWLNDVLVKSWSSDE